MCNAYRIGPHAGRFPRMLSEDLGKILFADDRLIRRTDIVPVVTADGTARSMRWGFERPRLGTINNSRAEKLDGPMWAEAFRERRCLIPASAFYEWSGPKGRKRTHRFTRTDGSPFLIAGIWEESPGWGPCFSMVTTEANLVMAPIHSRMPVYLEDEEVEDYLRGLLREFSPSHMSLLVSDAPNPLAKTEPPDAIQGELF